ncbi:MAG: DUF7230 family protein [Candidatus Poseidoniaceae archaeon]
MKKKSTTRSNPVAKHSHKFNRPSTHVDRKKEVKKRGYPQDLLYPNNEHS